MTGPTSEDQVTRITALANDWLKASLADVAAQQAAGASKVKAEELRRFLEANRTLVDVGLKEFTAKSNEFERLKASEQEIGDAARAAAAANQAAHDKLEAYILSIVQSPVAEAPIGGFR